jgi:hypothetical protein
MASFLGGNTTVVGQLGSRWIPLSIIYLMQSFFYDVAIFENEF